jgi:HTH-type transcriptional regulator, cell division transcriptional repressor
MNIAKIIRDGREKLNLNQSQLAELVGVSPQAVQQWESGATQPRGKRLNKIAEVLRLPPALMHFGIPPGRSEGSATTPGVEGAVGTTPASQQSQEKSPDKSAEDSKDTLIKEVINAMQRMSKEDAIRLMTISKVLVGDLTGVEPKEDAVIDLKALPVPALAPHPPSAFPSRRVSPAPAKTRGKTAIR